MSAAYCRMVVRVHPELPERLTTTQTYLFEETRIKYSYAAIVEARSATSSARTTPIRAWISTMPTPRMANRMGCEARSTQGKA